MGGGRSWPPRPPGFAAPENKSNGGFCEEQLSENDFDTVLVSFCCYDYGANASEVLQKINTRTLLELCQLTKTVNFITTTIENIFSSLLPTYWRYKPGLLFS